MRGMGPHPALRERGRAIPPGPPAPPPATRPITLPPHVRVRSPLSVYYEHEQPPPIPGMRPPLGSPGGPVPAPKSSMGFVMPIYTICIIVFFVYTLTKIMFRRQGSPYDPVAPDPQFRRRVFRDDSRSSPEKLGKKEADTIVTAISGLVAEVQQQMEASAAPNQQRQDVQDNARPYTNGTILLNSGPVQIVTSEYKEASKEKTPEPVTEKESTPEPKEAEATKVVTEPRYKDGESITGPKDCLPEVEYPSPEPSVIPHEFKATPETVVDKESSPEPAVAEDCKEPSSDPEVAEKPSSEPPPNLPVIPSVSEIAVESRLEPTSELTESTSQSEGSLESKVLQVSAPESNLSVIEAIPLPGVPKVIDLNIVSEEISSELKESSLGRNDPLPETNEITNEPNKPSTELVEPTTELKTFSPEHKDPISVSKDCPTESEKLLVEPIDTNLQSNEPISELNEPLPSAMESSPKPEQTLIEPKESSPGPKELSSEFNVLSLDPLLSNIELQDTSSKPEESSVQRQEFPLESEEPVTKPKETSLEPKEMKDLSLESKQSLLDSVSDSNNLPEPEDPETITSSLNIKQPILDPVIVIPEHQTDTTDNESLSESKDSTHRELSLELTENSQEVKAPILECSIESEFTKHSTEIEAPVAECSPESEFTEHSSNIAAPIVESSPETIITEQSPDVQSESLRLKESTSQSKETTPERKLTEESKTIKIEENASVPEGTLLDLEEAIADVDERAEKHEEKDLKDVQSNLQDENAGEELLKMLEGTKAATDIKDDLATANDQFLQEERFVVVRRSTPDVVEENKNLSANESKPADDYTLYTEGDEEDLENAAVKVMGMETTAHPADGGAWPRDERPPQPVSPPPRAPHAAEEVKSIFLETEIPQQSRVLVANFQEERPRPLVVSGKMTLSLIQDAPRDTPERDPESTLDDFTTASAVTQPAAEKGEMESDEEIDEEIEVEEIELEEEEEEEEEEPAPKAVKTAAKK